MHIIFVLFERANFVEPTMLDIALILNVTFFMIV